MTHQEAVDILKNLPKGRKWSTQQALAIVQELNKDAFRRLFDHGEAVTAGMIGHRWQAVAGATGYDTSNNLKRWLGVGANEYGNPEILFDAKTQKPEYGVGYSDKVLERVSKASEYLELRDAEKAVVNGIIFHTGKGAFFQIGIDHEGVKPRFGGTKRPIVEPRSLPAFIDGQGGILPAILLTSTTTWDGSDFVNLGAAGIQEINRTLTRVLKTVFAEVNMEKIKKHLDAQADKVLEQATDQMMRSKRGRQIVGKKVAETPEALEEALAAALADGKLADFLATLSPAQKKQLKKALG